MHPTALVTGGTGFLGGHVVRELLAQECEVRALVRPTSDRSELKALPVKFVTGDLRDPSSLEEAVKGADLVFHGAADYRFFVPDVEAMRQVNVDGTVALCRAAVEAGVSRIVYTSSAATVRCPDGKPGTEDDFMTADECQSTYQRTKVLAEQAVWQMIGEGAPITIVNPSTFIGAGDRRPTPTGRMIADYLSGKLPAYVGAVMNWVAVADVARGHWLAATRGRPGERYILANADLPLSELFGILSEVSGRPAPRVKIPYAVAYAAGAFGDAWGRLTGAEPRATLDGARMTRHPMRYTPKKAVEELGFPQTPIRLAAQEAVQWFDSERRRQPSGGMS